MIKFAVRVGLLAALAVQSLLVPSANADKLPTVGVVLGSNASAAKPYEQAFRLGLRAHGYTDGKDIVVVVRYANGDLTQFPRLLGELVAQQVEDFYYAGGLRALVAEMKSLLDLSQRCVNGATLGENIDSASSYNHDVIAPLERPLQSSGGLAVLRGNLAPDGAVIKPSAAEPKLLQHTGKAVVFEDYDDMARRIDDENLAVDAASVLVLRNAGPLGGPGMPEWGMLPIPKKLLKQSVRDMVRISDARMSGTSYGACVLHVAPESFVGGPLALVNSGDPIELNVPARRLELKVSDAELQRRRAAWTAPQPKYRRGYGVLFSQHITQANEGCDFRFLEGTAPTSEPEIH